MTTSYLIHNTSRARDNRTLRATQPTHRGHKQFALDDKRRLLRGRPLLVNEEVLKANLENFKVRSKQGLIKVTTTDQRPVNLETFDIGRAVVESPPVNKRLDSAANDKPGGQVPVVQYPGDNAIPQEFTMPVDAPAAAFDKPIEALTSSPVDVMEDLVPPPVEQEDPSPRLAGPLGGEGHPVTVTSSHERSSNKKKGGR